MDRLRDKLDSKYMKICLYAGATVVITVVVLMILAYSGGFWEMLWSMFTAVLKPVITGGIICYLFLPAVKKIETLISKKETKWRRPAAVAIFYVAAGLIVLLLLIALFLAVKGSIDDLSKIDPEALKEFALTINEMYSNEIAALEEKLSTLDIPIGKAGDMVGRFVNAVSGFFSGLLFGIIFSIYFMLDGENIARYWKRAFAIIAGNKASAALEQFEKDADRSFSGYIRGQFIDAVLVGIMSTIALYLGGVPYAAVVGIMIGVGNLIPYVGPVVGYGAVIIICLIMGQYDKLVIGVLIIAVIMFVDGNVINPRLLSDNVDVHPLLVVAALLAGGAIGGFVGMLIAVPTAALIKLQFDRYLNARDQVLHGDNGVSDLV